MQKVHTDFNGSSSCKSLRELYNQEIKQKEKPSEAEIERITFLSAACDGDERTMMALIHRGVDVSVEDKKGQTAIAFAAERGNEYITRLLLENGADANIGGLALCRAAKNGHKAIVKLLLDNGADVNAGCSGPGGSALMQAAQTRHEAIVKLLLDNGADVNAGW